MSDLYAFQTQNTEAFTSILKLIIIFHTPNQPRS